MEKIDLLKKDKRLYTPGHKAELVDVPEMKYLSVTGQGDPSGPEFASRIQSLYPVAYALKFGSKDKGRDFVVSKLEGLWWFDHKKYSGLSIAEAPAKIPRDQWQYRLMIRMPEHITASNLEEAISIAVSKRKIESDPGLELYTLKEGRSVQIMHTGSFEREPESLQLIQDFINANNLKQNGLHHEIYLSDFRKTEPEKLKTILREPIE